MRFPYNGNVGSTRSEDLDRLPYPLERQSLRTRIFVDHFKYYDDTLPDTRPAIRRDEDFSLTPIAARVAKAPETFDTGIWRPSPSPSPYLFPRWNHTTGDTIYAFGAV